MKLILIDADILTYSIGFSVQTTHYVCQGSVYKRKGFAEREAEARGLDKVRDVHRHRTVKPFAQCAMNLGMKLKMMFDDLGTHNYRMFITHTSVEENYRDKIATIIPYKGNRADFEKPYYYNKLREYLVKNYKAELITGQEADDMIGIEQYRIAKEKGSFEHTVIASIDKDLRGLEGYHYNLNSRVLDYVDEETASKNFYKQLLTGDNTDNIPGLTKLLKLQGRTEEANKISYGHYLKNFNNYMLEHTAEECYTYVMDSYSHYGFGDKEINEIGDLLWMRREPNQIWSRDVRI